MDWEQPARKAQSVRPYSVLAAGYDFVMSHVDYDLWAEYVQQLIEAHHPDAHTILELGCGTGSLALALELLGSYRYLATDASPEMIAVARQKAREQRAPVRFERADFTSFRVDRPVDVILLLFDGLNYLLDREQLDGLMKCAFEALTPGGIFIVDQSTPANSVNNEAYFEDRDRLEDFSYVRRSRYDRKTRIHQTTLELSVGDRHFCEDHLQRAYELKDVRPIMEDTGFLVAACYDGFTTTEATTSSERAHWVLRRPESKSDRP